MDEPTAHLDELTEMVIADTIVELARTSAVVVVAHDPSIVALGDQVIALETPAPVALTPTPPPASGRTADDTGPVHVDEEPPPVETPRRAGPRPSGAAP